ncbi:MAG: hypothetical protein KDA65_06315 [Planctomycetaceae bacterium]|nr:hypothetical protein [Planctomycetaceae bacterium]
MFFRFGAAILLIVLICLIGIAIEKQNLDLRRDLSRQHAQSEELLEAHARLRLQTQQLGATSRLMREAPSNEEDFSDTEYIRLENNPRVPLLRWRPFAPRVTEEGDQNRALQ